MLKSIKGVYFQEKSWLDIGYGVDGSDTFIKKGLCPTMYTGIIFTEEGRLKGYMHDFSNHPVRDSILSLILISDKEIQFTRKYEGREELIHYTFKTRKKGNIWVGEYAIDKGSSGFIKGDSRCVISDVDEELFFLETDPESISSG